MTLLNRCKTCRAVYKVARESVRNLCHKCSPKIRKEELDAIKNRETNATPGPWAFERHGEKPAYYRIGIAMDKDCMPCGGEVEIARYDEDQGILIEDMLWGGDLCRLEEATVNYRDADFIAHAREDIPRLLAEIERLRTLFGDTGAIP